MNESFIKISSTCVKSQTDPGLGTALCRVGVMVSHFDLPPLTATGSKQLGYFSRFTAIS